MTNAGYAVLTAGAVVLGLCGGALLGYGAMTKGLRAGQSSQPAVEVIRAQRFELVNQTGERRAALGVGLEGEPALALYAKDGAVRVELSLQPDGRSTLLFFDRDKQTPRAGLTVLPNGSPSLELSDKEGTLRTMFGLGGDGVPILGGFDEQGNLSTVFDLNQDAATLALEPENGATTDEPLCNTELLDQKLPLLPTQLAGHSAPKTNGVR
jgi:hypothetical protein